MKATHLIPSFLLAATASADVLLVDAADFERDTYIYRYEPTLVSIGSITASVTPSGGRPSNELVAYITNDEAESRVIDLLGSEQLIIHESSPVTNYDLNSHLLEIGFSSGDKININIDGDLQLSSPVYALSIQQGQLFYDGISASIGSGLSVTIADGTEVTISPVVRGELQGYAWDIQGDISRVVINSDQIDDIALTIPTPATTRSCLTDAMFGA